MASNLGSVGVHKRRFNRRFDKRYGGFGKDYIFVLISIRQSM